MTNSNTTENNRTAEIKNSKNLMLTPQEIVNELDKYIVGQEAAKKTVAVALRNRWRRQQVPEHLRDEITPKNIILIGSTGIGKTEIARRLAKLAKAPFIKVEASKFTEVGYVGRDVESIIRDLLEASIQLIKEEERLRLTPLAQQQAEERLLDALLPENWGERRKGEKKNEKSEEKDAPSPKNKESREQLRKMLQDGDLDNKQLDIDYDEKKVPMMQIFSSSAMEDVGTQLQDLMGSMLGKRSRKRRVKVSAALKIFVQEEIHKLTDHDSISEEAIQRTEQWGIIFLDEIDKIARQEGGQSYGPDISREGVQRDILPIVEGSQVNTKYGPVKTDHILFIAAGAFHVSKVSDLIPELQGRFPIRVELLPLGEEELLRILQEPHNALPIQYQALLATENVNITFTPKGLKAIAHVAQEANMKSENIGARRLHAIFEALLEDLSFHAPEHKGKKITINETYVQQKLQNNKNKEDLSKYIL